MSEGFSYRYSGSQKDKVKNIIKKYSPISNETEMLNRIEELDHKAQKRSIAKAAIFGTIGILIVAAGIVFTFIVEEYFFIGIIIGVIGVIIVALTFPLYRKVQDSEMEKVKPEILSLAEKINKN